MAETSLTIQLISAAPIAEGQVFDVASISHHERIGQLFETTVSFEVAQELPFDREDVAALISAPCHVRLSAESVDRVIHGVFTELSFVGSREGGRFIYEARIAPAVSKLGDTYRSRVFQSMSYPYIAQKVLEGHGFVAGPGQDFELRLTRGERSDPEPLPEPGPGDDDFANYAQREYTVQVEETDLAFVQRLLEHEGLFCFIESGDAGATFVIADDNASGPDQGTVEWGSVEDVRDRGRVLSLRRTHRPRAAEVTVSDYNWRTPDVALRATEATVDDLGAGLRALYGEHFKTPTEGQGYAALRAQREVAQMEMYDGVSTSSEISAGHRFTLAGAPYGDFDQTYLVLECVLKAHASLFASSSEQSVQTSFVAMPAGVPFRPDRVTPRPSLAGLMHARIDGIQIGVAAPIDADGRYKVTLPWDLYAESGGRATRWIRMAQPHAGPDFGMHFPLDIGTEVLLAHLGGDPDRPVIVGSVPNRATVSPVTADNATQSRIKTRSGILLEFEDDAL